MDLTKHFLYVGAAKPGAQADITHMRGVKYEVNQSISDDDGVILDRYVPICALLFMANGPTNALSYYSAYMSIENEMTHGQWHVKQHATRFPLTPEQAHRNEQLEVFRKHIEHTFADVKSRFAIFRAPFRHNQGWISTLWHLCCAFHNLVRDHQIDPAHFSTSWQGPLPHLEKPPSKWLKVHFLNSSPIVCTANSMLCIYTA